MDSSYFNGTQSIGPRACRSCANVKAKCVPCPDSAMGKCVRCHRLKKSCEPQAPAPRKARKPRTTRTAQLEKKLDGIVTLLTNGQNAPAPVPVSFLGSTTSAFSSSSSSRTAVGSPTEENSKAPSPVSTNWVLPTPTQSVLYRAGSQLPRTGLNKSFDAGQDADILLDVFRIHMAPQFPFVTITSGINATDLCNLRPFLYRAVVVVSSCGNIPQQIALRKEFIREITEQLLIQNKKSLDLLQALLVFLAWYHYHLPLPQFTNLCHLAIALAVDLGLNKPPTGGGDHESFVEVSKCVGDRANPRHRRTLDECRAFIGIFWLTSSISGYISRIEPLRATVYIDECIRVVEETKECPSDRSLVILAKFQVFIEKIRHDLASCHGIDQAHMMYIKMLASELQQLADSLHLHFAQNNLHINFYAARVSTFAFAFQKAFPSLEACTNTVSHFSLITSLLASLRQFFDAFLNLSPSYYFSFPTPIFSHLPHAIIALAKLTFLDFPGWDADQVRSTLDMGTLLSDLAVRFEDAGKEFEVDPLTLVHNDVFSRIAKKLRRVGNWVNGRLRSRQAVEAVDFEWSGQMNQKPDEKEQGGGTEETSINRDAFDACFLDDGFWAEMINGWES